MITLDTENIYSVSDTKRLMNKAIMKGTCYKSAYLNYHNIICAFDIETSNIRIEGTDNGYKNIFIYRFLHNITIRITDLDLQAYKLVGFKLSYTKGQPLDELYQEVIDIFPGFIREDLISPDDQLKALYTLYKDNEPADDVERYSIMYCWQFAIDGKVIFGRTWMEFIEFYDIFSSYADKKNRIIVYVHSLAHEFQFIRQFFSWYKVFSINTRKPIYAITEQGIEFRCSYILTNYSLEKLSEQLHYYKIHKLVGNLDYSLWRSPDTPLEKQEVLYAVYDVLVVSAYIQECLTIQGERYLSNIPLTATGYCRRYCRKMCLYTGNKKNRNGKDNPYNALMRTLTIDGKEEYLQLKRAFQGGFTHASSYWSGKTLHNMDSIDFTSSYPYVLLAEQFPMSKGKRVRPNSKEEFEEYLKYYCCIFDIELIGVTPKFLNENYISVSHCFEKVNVVNNNGRLVSADKVALTITNVDYRVIRRCYDIEHVRIHNMRIYRKGYLPKPLILAISKLYADKTTLKGIEGKEVEYLNSKGLLNACFGMMVTDISKDEIIYNDSWSTAPADIDKDIEKYNKSPKRFLFYPWGVFCTAYARYNLWTGIFEFGDSYVYSDTDSIKCLDLDKHQDYIRKYNKHCEYKLRLMCKHYGLTYEDILLPKTIKGEEKPIGIWDYDGHYDTFKTLGAKRYLVKHGDTISMTVAGVNKKVCVPYLISEYGDKIFDKFEKGLHIPEGKTGKLTHAYIDYKQSGSFTDYLGNEYTFINDPPGVYLEPAAYDFDITQEYLDYLKGVQYSK